MTGARLTTRVGLDIIRQGLYILHSCRSLGVEVWGRKVRGKHTVGRGTRGKGETREGQDLASPLACFSTIFCIPSLVYLDSSNSPTKSPAQPNPDPHPYTSIQSTSALPGVSAPGPLENATPAAAAAASRSVLPYGQKKKKEGKQVQTNFQDVGSQKCL